MRLANGIVLDKEKTFGVLKFSALRHEVRMENEDGTTSEEIKRRTYDDMPASSNLTSFIRKLRKKVEPDPNNPQYIITVWGVGYKFSEEKP